MFINIHSGHQTFPSGVLMFSDKVLLRTRAVKPDLFLLHYKNLGCPLLRD